MRVTVVSLLLTGLARAADPGCCDQPLDDCCEAAPPPTTTPPPAPPSVPVVVLAPVVVGQPAQFPAKKRDNRFLGKLSVGGAYQLMLDESVGGAAFDLMLGAEDRRWGGGGQLGLVTGRISGLTFTWVRFGGGFEWHLGERVRFDLGMSGGVLAIERATRAGSWMASATLGAHLGVSVDLRRNQLDGWYFFAKTGGDFLLSVTHLSPGALLLTSGLGYRL